MTTEPSPQPSAPAPALSLRRGTAFNLAGQIIPAAAALVAIPVIQRRLGNEQLGILMLTWAAVGYLGIFDLGFRRALTGVVAGQPVTGDHDRTSALIWTTGWSLAALGVLAALAVIGAGPWLVPSLVSAGRTSNQGAWIALFAIAASMPFVAVASAQRGVIEGHQRFGLLNAVRTPIAVAGYLGPMVAALLSPSVVPAVVVLAATRILGTAALAVATVHVHPALRRPRAWSTESIRDLISTGGWMTVANVVGSVMLYLDRFAVGALAPLAAVAYYTTPQEVVSKLLIISSAAATTAFPAMAAQWASASAGLPRVYERTTTATLIGLFVPAFALAMLAPDWLGIWMGPAFAANASAVVRWVAVGTLLAGVAALPLALLQATGRSGLTAAFQIGLLPVYALMVWFMTRAFGIEGAAAAWTLRMVLESLLLFGAGERVTPRGVRFAPILIAVAGLALLPLAAAGLGPVSRVLLVGSVALLTVAAAHRWLGFDIRQLADLGRPSAAPRA